MNNFCLVIIKTLYNKLFAYFQKWLLIKLRYLSVEKRMFIGLELQNLLSKRLKMSRLFKFNYNKQFSKPNIKYYKHERFWKKSLMI